MPLFMSQDLNIDDNKCLYMKFLFLSSGNLLSRLLILPAHIWI